MSDFNWGREKDEFKWGGNNSKSLVKTSNAPTHKQTHELQPISAREYVDIARESMGMIERFQFDKENRKAVKEYALNTAGDLAEKQRELIEKRIQYDFDVEQKKMFANYLNDVKHVDVHLENSLKDIEKNMMEFFVEHMLDLKSGKKYYKNKFQSMIENGLLDKEDADDLNIMVNSKVNRVSAGASHRFDLLVDSYGKQYEKAMEKLREEVIKRII